VQLTIEIPDEVGQQWGDRKQLEERLARVLRQMPNPAIVEEVADFLGRGPQPREIVAFHASEQSERRIRELLDKNRENHLTLDEEAELNAIQSLNYLFAFIKARAWDELRAAS